MKKNKSGKPSKKDIRKSKKEALIANINSRLQMASMIGLSYGANNNDRDLYQALGYKKTLTYTDYYNFFKRDGIAKTIVQKLPKATWKSQPNISEMDGTKADTGLEAEWRQMAKDLQLFNKFYRADSMLGLGEYSLLLLGFNDTDDFSTPVIPKSNLELLYVHPFTVNAATIESFESDPKNERFNKPLLYNIEIVQENATTASISASMVAQTVKVHYSRVIHIVEDSFENDNYGTPRLEPVYNYCQDLQKIGGGSGEMFWRGARPGFAAQADKDATLSAVDADNMQDQFDEYEHNLRRILTLRGIEMKGLSPQVASPLDHIEAQLTFISITTGIPKRILMGTERGELASTQDTNAWNELVIGRMVNFAEPEILRPFIDYMIELGVFTAPKGGEYAIEWPELTIIGEKERAEINHIKTKTLVEYVKAPGADMYIPPEMFLQTILEMNEEEIIEIQKTLDGDIGELDEKDECTHEGNEGNEGDSVNNED